MIEGFRPNAHPTDTNFLPPNEWMCPLERETEKLAQGKGASSNQLRRENGQEHSLQRFTMKWL